MSHAKVVTPIEAQSLLEQGYRYLDVRSEPEFEAGHPPGAFNIPLLKASAGGLTPNEDFLAVTQAHFELGDLLVIGCKSGGRSRRAVEILQSAGYQELVELAAGWDGKRDAVGRLQPGWCRLGLPSESGMPENRRYSDLVPAKDSELSSS